MDLNPVFIRPPKKQPTASSKIATFFDEIRGELSEISPVFSRLMPASSRSDDNLEAQVELVDQRVRQSEVAAPATALGSTTDNFGQKHVLSHDQSVITLDHQQASGTWSPPEFEDTAEDVEATLEDWNRANLSGRMSAPPAVYATSDSVNGHQSFVAVEGRRRPAVDKKMRQNEKLDLQVAHG